MRRQRRNDWCHLSDQPQQACHAALPPCRVQVHAMQDLSLANCRVRVGGPEMLTFRQLAAVIGRVLGREVGAGRPAGGRRKQCVEPRRMWVG